MESGPDPSDSDTPPVRSFSPSPSKEGSATSSPVSVRSPSPAAESEGPDSDFGRTSSSSSPNMERSSSMSPDSPRSDSSSSSNTAESVTPRPGPDHSYALPGPDSKSKSPQKIPQELVSLNLAKKLEDCSLPSIEDVLRHCVHIRENCSEPNSRFTATDVAWQATEDVVEVWQQLSSKFSGDVIMTKGKIQRKVATLMERYRHLIINTTAMIKRSQLVKMSVEVGKLFDILSCKK